MPLVVGQSYNAYISITGATSASITSGALPGGLVGSYNSDTSRFTITGTPETAATYNFTITAINACGSGGSDGSFARDYSLTVAAPPAMSASIGIPNPQYVNEGGQVVFSYTITNRQNQNVYWRVEATSPTSSAAITSEDFSTPSSGVINTDSGNITLTISSDLTTENFERFRLVFYTNANYTDLLALSTFVEIVDTSVTPPSTCATPTLVSNITPSAATQGTYTGTIQLSNTSSVGVTLNSPSDWSVASYDKATGTLTISGPSSPGSYSVSINAINNEIPAGCNTTEIVSINAGSVTICNEATSATQTVTGSLTGTTVWGSNPYTQDSDFAVAAVHAGLVAPGATATITKTFVGYLQNYSGTTANGVTTTNWTTGWCGVQISLASGGGGGSTCFAYGTKILMSDGTSKNIEDLQENDIIKTVSIADLDTQETAWEYWSSNSFVTSNATATVKSIYVHTATHYYNINDGLLKVTDSHPILVEKNGIYRFKRVDSLTTEDRLFNVNNEWISINSIQIINEQLATINIDVEEQDTYFANGILVHNKNENQQSTL